MNDHELTELAEVIRYGRGEDASVRPCECDRAVAEAVIAAGYRKLRVIATAEEVESLPHRTKLYSEKTTHSWELRDLSGHGGVRVTGTGGGYTYISDFIKYEAPFTVLHEPQP